MVNAIVEVGNGVIAAVTGSPAQGGKDSLRKTIEALKDTLLPEDREGRDKAALKARKKLEDEIRSGPITFRALTHARKRPKLSR